MQTDQWRPDACLRMVRDTSAYRARVRRYSEPLEASSDSECILESFPFEFVVDTVRKWKKNFQNRSKNIRNAKEV